MISELEITSINNVETKRAEIIANYPLIGLSDCAIYHYVKESKFLSKREERLKMYFFQGLNTYPQNLSIFLMDEVKRESVASTSKEKLVKGIFHVYNFYDKCDSVIEVNIPGTLKIFKILNGKKEAMTSEEVDLMYISSILRTMYEKNIKWGRYYELFRDAKSMIQEFETFMCTMLKYCIKREIFINEEFESTSEIKGSHSLSIILRFVKDKHITTQCLEIIKKQIKQNKEMEKSPKINIFVSELYSEEGKYSKSIEHTMSMANLYAFDPYILYYQAKYLYSLFMLDEALKILDSIVQYNQFEIWILLARIHADRKNYTYSLICLSHAAKQSKCKTPKSVDFLWKEFAQIGKAKNVTGSDPIEYHPSLHIKSEHPLNIPVKTVQESMIAILEHPSWRLNPKEKEIYKVTQTIKFKMEQKKFHELIQETFLESGIGTSSSEQQIIFKKGLSESMFMTSNVNDIVISGDINHHQQQRQQLQQQNDHPMNQMQKLLSHTSSSSSVENEEIPNFLNENDSEDHHPQPHPQPQPQMSSLDTNRNLSIIPEIESVIENSNYEETLVTDNQTRKPQQKREMNETLFKVLKILLTNDGEYEKAVFEKNLGKILPIYNELRSATKNNNYFAQEMFKIFAENGHYSSIVVLIAETLDFIEKKGMKKIRKLPYWMESYIFFIINEKGLVFLNTTCNKLKYIDEAILDTIELAKSWKISGLNI